MTNKPKHRLDPDKLVRNSERAALLRTKGKLIPNSDPELAKLLDAIKNAKPDLEGIRVPPERAAAIMRDIEDGANRLRQARYSRADQERKKCSILTELGGIEANLTKEHNRFCRASGLEEMGVLGYKKGGPSARNNSLTDGFAGGRYFIALGKVMRGLIAEIRDGLEKNQDVTELLNTLRRVVSNGMTRDEAINFIVEKTTNGKTYYL